MSLLKDVQFSLRTMWKSPRITITVLATLVLGIGANTAIFSIVNATLLKPLPFRDPGQLVELRADLRDSALGMSASLFPSWMIFAIAPASSLRYPLCGRALRI